MKNIPDKIYLQIGDIPIDDVDFNDLLKHAITWCDEKINDNDIEYLRNKPNNISDVIPMLKNINKILDTHKLSDENEKIMSDVVLICQNIIDDYWLFKN